MTVPSKVVLQARIVSLEWTGPCRTSPETNERSPQFEVGRLCQAYFLQVSDTPVYTGSWISNLVNQRKSMKPFCRRSATTERVTSPERPVERIRIAPVAEY